MATLEIRRHAARKDGGGSQLSQVGVDRARALGAAMGPFDLVATSVVPRARETALAMGFAVDHELVPLTVADEAYIELGSARWWEAEQPFAALAEALDTAPAFRRYAYALASSWRDLLTPLGGDAAVLVIGHSGDLEAALVAALPGADHGSWGGAFGHLEGARLGWSGDPGRFGRVEMLRVDRLD